MITATRRTVTEHRAECKTREELLEALKLAPANTRIWIHVPGGGDYSNCVLNLFDDLPVCLSWKTEETTETALEPETVEVWYKDRDAVLRYGLVRDAGAGHWSFAKHPEREPGCVNKLLFSVYDIIDVNSHLVIIRAGAKPL
jgi:hypothetical protein